MADAPAAGAKSSFGFLSHKTGPFPLWVWIAGGIGAYYLLGRGKTGTGTGTGSAPPNQQTDPAGNIGTIDPATGYVYGTPEDLAALAANNSTGTTGTGTTTTTGYADNAAWGRAAVNFLVGTGIDPTQANEAITTYLASQQLTTQQQADVNAAITALGAPPSLPGPVGAPPGGVVTPPGGGGNVKVPNEVGKTAGQAHNDLTAAGLVPQADPGQKATDKVTSTSPAAGRTVPKGTRVLITATGSGTVTVPNEAGKSAGQAHNDLVAAGLVPVAPESQKANYKVWYTNPRAGSHVAKGTKVTINTRGTV